MRVSLLFSIIAFSVAMAACIQPPANEPPDSEQTGYRLRGNYASNVTSEEKTEFIQFAKLRGGILIGDDSPHDIDVRGIPVKEDCEEVRAFAIQASYIASITECRWWDKEDGY